METPKYDEFKLGIKRDLNNAVTNLAFYLGFLTLFISIAMMWLYLLSRYSPLDTIGKIVSSITIVGIILTLVFNKKISNTVILSWLRLLTLMTVLAFSIFAGWFIYVISKEAFKGLF